MARRRSIVDGLLCDKEENTSARWAFVGGLKEESRICNALSLSGVDERLRIRKVSEE